MARAVVGPCEVELAWGVGQGRADARADQGVADLRSGGARGAVELFLSPVGTGPCFRRGDLRVGAEGDPGQLADHSRRQLDREVGDLLFGVVSGEADVEGREASRGVVQGSGDQARFERRKAAARAGLGFRPGDDLEGRGGGYRGSAAPGVEGGFGVIGAAAWWACQWRAGSLAEVQLEVGVGQLRAARWRSWSNGP